MLSVLLLSAVMLSAAMLSVIMLSVVMLSAVMLSVIMLSVVSTKCHVTILKFLLCCQSAAFPEPPRITKLTVL
jgi:hypothetical protein